MKEYTLHRCLLMIPAVLGVSLVILLMMHSIPGGPISILMGDYYTPEAAATVPDLAAAADGGPGETSGHLPRDATALRQGPVVVQHLRLPLFPSVPGLRQRLPLHESSLREVGIHLAQ
jgi:ABC-type dipeptide/oligopeptide/nickel transport system permease component